MSHIERYTNESDWMPKRLIFPPINERGEMVVNWITTENKELIKTAAAGNTTYHKRIRDYIGQVKPRKDMACCVISALGSYETWGQNINGDRFPRIMFHEGQHKTYEKVGLPFKHHLNKPEKGHPVYGERVTIAEFNDKMDRVELVVWYDLSKDTSLLNDIEMGNVGVSMGMKTPYDVCTIKGCGNVAKTPKEYCIHSNRDIAPMHGYRMGMILPDGQQIGRWNRYAKFFDISRVIIPAWQPGRILEKVASTGHKFWNINPEFMKPSAYLVKKAEEKKASMVKEVPPLAQESNRKLVEFMNISNEIQRHEPEIPNNILNDMAQKHSLKNIISTMLTLGVTPKPKEFQRLVLVKVGKKTLADEFEKNGHVFTQYEPSKIKASCLMEIDSEFCSEKIAMDLKPYMEDRSCLRPFLFDRLEKIASQNYLIPEINLEGKRKKDRNLGKEAVRTLAGIGGLYALMRGALSGGGQPVEVAGKTLMPTMAELGMKTPPPGFKIEKTLEKFMSTNPLVKMMILAALGGGAMTAWQKLKEPSILTNYDQPLDSPPLVSYNNGDYLKELELRNRTPLTKLGAWNPAKITSLFKGPAARTTGKTMMRAAIGLPAFYMLSGTLEAKRRNDPFGAQSEGSISSFLRKHPGLAATMFTFHPHAKDVAKGMFKKASLINEARDWAIFGAMESKTPTLGIASGIADAILINAASKAFGAIAKRTNKKNTKVVM